jgi:hypothetical protein
MRTRRCAQRSETGFLAEERERRARGSTKPKCSQPHLLLLFPTLTPRLPPPRLDPEKHNTQVWDLIVVGAGVAGAAVAYRQAMVRER